MVNAENMTREEMLEQLAAVRFAIVEIAGLYSVISASKHPFNNHRADKAARQVAKNAPKAFQELKELEKDTMDKLRAYDESHGIESKWGGE